ncbi:MAG: hypothetical protein KatS3mg105_2193 [Gemmatales bacterium]|nr:MAG: hypothetical protein KatS3mg105_2193 [Gemmatales bacterium]
MSSPSHPFAELQQLCEAAIEDRLTPEMRDRLEELVLNDWGSRKFYVEYLHQHAALSWSAADATLLAPSRPILRPEGNRRRFPTGVLLLAASVLLALAGWMWFSLSGSPYIATLASAKNCQWNSGTLPTEEGARLTAGRLRLAEGIVRIVFDSGADVTLEGPADLELLAQDRCVLHRGQLVAKVPPPAIGFKVETPTAQLIDWGTEFGVTVRDDSQETEVQVFSGAVDVRHPTTGETRSMKTGSALRFGLEKVSPFDPNVAEPALAQPASRAAGEGRVLDISTAIGAGRDAYVQPLFPCKNSSDVLLLVKNYHSRPGKNSDYLRKAYIGIDLKPIRRWRVVQAELTLAFAPSGLGFASEVPDATFSVYGLTDESLDDWDEKLIRWHNAPANREGGAEVDLTKAVWLGSFVIPQGVSRGTRSISGAKLVEFLNQDTNNFATFILVRDTKGSGRSDLVHGFASKRHPNLPPPTLKLTVVPKE